MKLNRSVAWPPLTSRRLLAGSWAALATLVTTPAAAVVTFDELRVTSAIPSTLHVVEIHVYDGAINQATPAGGASASATSQKGSNGPGVVIDGVTGSSPANAWVSATGEASEMLTITWTDDFVREVDRVTLWASTEVAADNLYNIAFLWSGNLTYSGQIDARSGGSRTIIISMPGPSPIPEPASWALMIAGFGLVGGAVRRNMRPARGCR